MRWRPVHVHIVLIRKVELDETQSVLRAGTLPYAEGSLTEWLLCHAPPEAAAFLRRHADDMAVESIDYDWSLNGA